MPIKELAHSIVDSFNENQLKGFVDLFIKSEPAVEDRSIETIMRSLAMDYIHNYSSARYSRGDFRIASFSYAKLPEIGLNTGFGASLSV